MITRMFHERVLFCPEHVSTKRKCKSRYLSLLTRDISMYQTFAKLQEIARKREIELETQVREEAKSHMRDWRPTQSQLAGKAH